MRFSVLTRDGNNWLLQQMHFQGDDRDPSSTHLFHPEFT